MNILAFPFTGIPISITTMPEITQSLEVTDLEEKYERLLKDYRKAIQEAYKISCGWKDETKTIRLQKSARAYQKLELTPDWRFINEDNLKTIAWDARCPPDYARDLATGLNPSG
jgi:hypothetical protein